MNTFLIAVCAAAVPVGVASGWAVYRSVEWMDSRSEHRCNPAVLRIFTAVMSLAVAWTFALGVAAYDVRGATGDQMEQLAAILGGIPAVLFGTGLGQRKRRD